MVDSRGSGVNAGRMQEIREGRRRGGGAENSCDGEEEESNK